MSNFFGAMDRFCCNRDQSRFQGPEWPCIILSEARSASMAVKPEPTRPLPFLIIQDIFALQLKRGRGALSKVAAIGGSRLRQMNSLVLQAITGMNLQTLSKVLLRNRCRVNWRYVHRLVYLLVLAAVNSYAARLEEACDGADIAAAELVAPPIFILGTWRSGTTHLHNLLGCDPTFTCPTAYQAMAPHHFVYSQPWGSKLFNFLTPGKRPMDNVAIHDTSPHEDEMALASLCGVSPYMRILFPVTGDNGFGALDPSQLPPGALAEWQGAFRLFLKKLSFSKSKRIVLKSPPHLGRIPILVEMFPGAKFIHIVRTPYVVYLSTKKLWNTAWACSHLQKRPDPQAINELVLSWNTELLSLYHRDRALIPPGSLHELRFEDLETSPRKCLEKLYAELGLPGFEAFWERAEAYLKSIAGYRKNSFFLTEADRDQVSRRWVSTFSRYGYPVLPPLGPGETLRLG